MDEVGVFQTIHWYAALPPFIRSLFFRILDKSPNLMKNNGHTVMPSTVGMLGRGHGWAIPFVNLTLNVTVGGISEKPGALDGQIEVREFLCPTIRFDHDHVDEASAARVFERLKGARRER